MSIDALLGLPGHLRERLRGALDTGALRLPSRAMSLQATAGINEDGEAVCVALNALHARGLDGPAIAAWFEAIEQVEARHRRPDLVWSGPQVPGVPTRDTRTVVDELIRGAERSLWISSFVYFDGPRAFATLAERMDAAPSLQVRLLLNVERPYGNTSASDALVARFAHRFWTEDWPGKRRPEVYYAPNALEPGENRGVLHAKVVIADEEAVLVTSANLTEAAFDRNVEAGLLVRDRVVARSAVRQLVGLIERGHLVGVPPIGLG